MELLLEEAQSTPDRAALGRIERRLAQLASLVERLLLLTSPVSDLLAGEAVALSDLTQEVAAARPGDQRSRLRLEIRDEGVVRGDPALLRALLENALDNALKFSAPETVDVAIREHGHVVQLDVVDAGPGVPTDEQTRVFEPFYRISGALAPGHGLGLALIRHIAAAHAGQARFLPREGGAHLRVELPAWQPDQPRMARSAQIP